jgi:tetratricopeptide (TPR) repeat protein
MKYSLALFLLILFSWTSLEAQTEKQFLKAGNEAYENGDYYEAIAYLKDALKFNKNSSATYRIAMSYYNLKDYDNALPYFEELGFTEDFPLLYFYQGSNNKLLGNYDKAIQNYQDFLAAYTIPGFYRDKATQEIASSYWAKDQQTDATVKIKHFDKPLNTGYSDFAATYMDSNVVQVSSLQSITKNLKSDFQSKIYFYEIEDKKVSESEANTFPIAREDSMDYANGFYLKEKNQFYYTQCYTEHEVGQKICDIYVRSFKNNQWGEAKSLNLNTTDFSETQPMLVVNQEGETEIYFVSDRAGGKGKFDIWQAKESTQGQFTEPLNLPSPINTIDNESTPYFDLESRTLFFSTEWHYGFGGYDIFKSELKKESWTEPKNLGAPINSSANDQYYYPSERGTALIASNRKGALQLKGSACCFDIYEHELPKTVNIDSSLLALEELSRKDDNSNKIETAFKELQKAIPLTVYFHNDEPNPKTTDTISNLTYQQSYNDYQKVKPLYFEEFDNEKAIANWFATVDESYAYLNRFLSILSNVLLDKQLTLRIEGYCSPLALNDYNINLAKRRIVSLENHLLQWNDGALKEFYDAGNLTFAPAAFGEEKADQNISDSVNETKYSIYDPKAAQERRVAIIAVEVY